MLSEVVVADRREAVINVIDEELSEVIRLNKQVHSTRPKLLLRIAELYLEKARILKEIENDRYLSMDVKKRGRKNKDSFFKGSRSYFRRAQKTCYFILKNFKKFKGKSDVLYILAFNAKEFRREKDAKKYFELSIRSSKKNSSTRKRSGLALAEIYFNKKQYSKALKLYGQTLKKRNSKWWTKDAYNWAWCYHHEGNSKKAIKLMKEIYRLSGQKNYYNMRNEVKRDLAFFYTESGRIKEAISFYKKDGSNIAKSLVKVGKHLFDQGKYSSAENVLRESLNYTKDKNMIIGVYNTLLNLFEKFGKIAKHLEISNKLYDYSTKGDLDKNQLADLKYHVKKMSAILQKQVVGKTYIRRPKIRAAKAAAAVNYFEIDSKLDNSKSHISIFHAGETLFAVGKYNKALPKYDESRLLAQRRNDKKIEKLSIDGMMASLGEKGISKENKSKYLVPMYKIYLKKDPKSRKANIIYQRLFSTLIDKVDIKGAERVLLQFQKNFNKDFKIQEAMLARIMDYHKDKGEKEEITRWIKRINNNEFRVSKKYASKLRQLVLTMQFEKVEKASTRGDKKWALKGYVSIYRGQESSKEAKKNAAYNISLLFHELGNINFAISWLNKALSLMSREDVRKFESSFLTMVTGFYARGRFEESAKYYKLIYNKICKSNSENKKFFFKNAITIYIATGKFNQASTLLSDGKRCKIRKKIVADSRFELVKALSSTKKWGLLEKDSTMLFADKLRWPFLIHSSYLLSKYYQGRKNSKRSNYYRNKVIEFYKYSKKKKMEIPLDSLDSYADLSINKLKFEIKKLENIKLVYPEKKYNKILGQMFKQIDIVTSQALSVLSIGSGEGMVKSYVLLIGSYRNFSLKIKSFTPQKRSKEYLDSFRKSMINLVKPIDDKILDFKREAKGHIKKNDILSLSNSHFTRMDKTSFPVKYISRKRGALMDRGGGR